EYIRHGYIAGFICMGVGVAGFITMLIILFRNKNIVAMKTRVISILLMTVLLFITFAPLIFYDPLKYQKQEDGTYSIVGCYPSADRVKIPATYGGSPVTKIEDNGFACCNKLTSVTIPNSVTSIGVKAFYWCPNLQSVILPGSITSIGKEAFAHCYSLSSITIPNGVTTISERAFEGSGLISIDLPDSLTSIGDFAFSGSTKLTSIVIPDGVTSIGAYVFEYCYSLESVILPGSITSIDGMAFSYCINLTSIIIPSSVTTLGGGVFASCSNLKTIKYCGTEEQWLAITKETDWDWCFGDDYTIIYDYAGE
ncbi:MAG: leucine-rich repeat domain-containing protein, partial [Clostridia bacterium]|nr:leucine-rich repeat domain-containing protein [Clostridia bacterium]